MLSVQSFSVAGDPTLYLIGQIATVEGGSLTVSQDGSYSFVPADNFNGDVPVITYTTNTDASDTLNIIVTSVEDPTFILGPNAGNVAEDANLTATGSLVTVDVDANDNPTLPHRLTLLAPMAVLLSIQMVSGLTT